MFAIGTVFQFAENGAPRMGVVLSPKDGKGRYGVMLLCAADPDTPEHMRLHHNGLALRADPWNTRCLAERELAAGVGEKPLSFSRENMDRICRLLGKSAARAHYEAVHAPGPFVPGESPTPVSGKCFGPEEMESLTEASLDFWLTTGRFNDAFESAFARVAGRKYALTVNSGSSANLVALAALCSPKLGERRVKPGDEVITTAVGFPTTVAPIVQYGLVPVFVDASPPTYNIMPEQIEAAVSEKTRAIFLAHTLGNPFDLAEVLRVASKYNLWVIEDACDALGSRYQLPDETAPRMCGSFGHIACYSFYPAHHITMGEGGAVVCDDPELYRIALSLRDWGRDCWCAPGRDDSCKRRYQWKFPLLPEGYDHKYVYSHLGYNLKITDMQAAVGLAQLERLPAFTRARQENFRCLHAMLEPLNGDKLTLPQATSGSLPSWFGFLITLAPDIDRTGVLEYLNAQKIGTRLLFAGNIMRQPCFEGVRHRSPNDLTGTDQIMRHTFWVGCYPGLREEHLRHIATSIQNYFR